MEKAVKNYSSVAFKKLLNFTDNKKWNMWRVMIVYVLKGNGIKKVILFFDG